MALGDIFSGALDKVRGMFNREPKAMDAFGGDDLFDGDGDGETKSNLGPKIAIAASGVMVLGLIGLVGFIIMSGDEAAAPTGGSLAGLSLEEDPDAVVDAAAERRPWLTPTQGGGRRLGLSEDAKSTDAKAPENLAGKPAPLPTREVAKIDAMKPPPAGKDTQAAIKPEAAKAPTPAASPAAEPAAPAVVAAAKTEPPKAEMAKGEPAKVEAVKPDSTKPDAAKPALASPAAAPAATQVAAAPAKAPEPATKPTDVKTVVPSPAPMQADEDPAPEEEQVAALPSLLAPAETAPGAPRRVESDNTGAAAAGGKPRLNDPRLPPVDKASVGAPPPRFAAITAIKGDAAPAAASSAKIAIIVEGLGLNKVATEAALAKLPPSVTLAFSPYARDLKKLMERAKQKGHEVLVEVPMESKSFPADDPGPLGLLTSLEPKDNQERLEAILKEATGAVGVFDGMGSKFRESQSHIGEVLAKLKQQNLFYVQGRPGIRVGETDVPSATADVVIDERPFRAAVDARFDYAERLAKYQGSSVAVMDALPVSFERLALWIDQLPKKGVTLAPVSQVLVQ